MKLQLNLQEWHWWLYHLLYGALHHTTWAIAIAWLIFACHNEHAYYLNRFLSFPFFIYLSKVSYVVFFIIVSFIVSRYLSKFHAYR